MQDSNADPLAQVKVVSLDAGGTLIAPSPSVGEIYAEVARQRNIKPPSEDTLNLRFKEIWKNSVDFDYSKEAWKRIVDYCFLETCQDGVDSDLFENIYIAFTNIENWDLYSDVELSLEVIRQNGVQLVLSSNWDERLKPLISGLGLEQYFDSLFISCELGFQKPDPRFFKTIANKMSCKPGEILHIGDCIKNDYKGAMEAGFQAKLLNRDETSTPAIDCIPSLMEIASVWNLPTISLE